MIFKQFYESSLGHASYLVGSEETGEALVLDVRRDVDDYYASHVIRGCASPMPRIPINTMTT
jgi:hypothetical protein